MNDYKTILDEFMGIQNESASDNYYNVVKINDMPHRLGRSAEGYPKFFVNTEESGSTVHNIIREILSVEYNVECELIDNDGNRQSGIFSIITLRSLANSLQMYFIEIFTMMLEKLPSVPSRKELSLEVENLISIFSALSNPPRKEIQGLWAELLVIERSASPDTLIEAWHSDPSSKYDFTLGRDKIEAKSSSKEERIHKFSLDQLNPSENSRLLVASTIVRESGQASDGLSIRGLYDKICTRVSSIDNRLKLYSVIAKTIGTEMKKIDNIFFDYTSASDNLLYFNSKDIPCINKDSVPLGVSEIKFNSNLSHVMDITNTSSYADYSESELFKCVI